MLQENKRENNKEKDAQVKYKKTDQKFGNKKSYLTLKFCFFLIHMINNKKKKS